MENSLEYYFSLPTDIDIAQFKIGAILGFWSADDDFNKYKGLFWTDNPIGNSLYKIIENLIDIGALKWEDYPVVVYNPEFKKGLM